MRQLEIAASSLNSALAAQAGGADRIELCENLSEGGTTPSYGMLSVVRERLRIPVFVLVRPRAGDFLYDDGEIDVMLRDIETCARLGCDGVVIGALDADGGVDMPTSRALIAAAGTMQVTFHRAFDAARDPAKALEDIVTLGCQRVLTSGAARSAPDGADAIAAHVRQANGRIGILVGAGVTVANLPALAERTGAREFHGSARSLHRSAMRHRNDALPGLEPDRMQTDIDSVRAMVAALRENANET